MMSNVQIVFVFDIRHFSGTHKNGHDFDKYTADLSSTCLNIMTGYSSLCTNGYESIRWSFKFFSSHYNMQDTTRRHFEDLSIATFDNFMRTIKDKHHALSDVKKEDCQNSEGFNMKKVLQEIVVDYDWDRPVICSPVKFSQHSTKNLGSRKFSRRGPQVPSEVNAVVMFTDLNTSEGQTHNCSHNYLVGVVDDTLKKQFTEKDISLHLINTNENMVPKSVTSMVAQSLKPLNGVFHEINSLANNIEAFKTYYSSKDNGNLLGFVNEQWLRSWKVDPPIKQISESCIIWEDEVGFTSLQIPITVRQLKARNETAWPSLIVCGVINSKSIPILCLSNSGTNVCLCSSSNTEPFTKLLRTLKSQDCCLILRHKHNGIVILGPMTPQLGCLMSISASGLATPPLAADAFKSATESSNQSLASYIDSFVKKVLMSAPPIEAESCCSGFVFNNEMLKSYYPSSQMPAPIEKRNRGVSDAKAQMLKKLKSKYRPQLPQLLCTDDAKPELIDVTEPTSAAAIPIKKSTPSLALKPQKPVTRGQQLASRGLILTARIKAQEHQNQLQQKHQANKRKVEAAEERTRRSNLLSSRILKDLGSTDTHNVLKDALISVRNDLKSDKENQEESNTMCDDNLLIVSQTIINVALAVLRSNCAPFLVGSELQATLEDGIFMSPADVASSFNEEDRLVQMKLQVLLHLELLWSTNSSNSTDSNDFGSMDDADHDAQTEGILSHLRSISLKFNPSKMALFLEQTILPNYIDSLGKVLCNIYEELNQLLPDCLKQYVSHEEPSPVKSIKSICSQQTESVPKSTESAPDQICKGTFRRTSNRIAIKNETTSRQIVVPRVNNGSKKTKSQSCSSSKEKRLKGVRRNLFDMDLDSKATGLRRCKTMSDFPTRPVMKTPRKRKASAAFTSPKDESDNDTIVLSPSKGNITPGSKRRKIYALETPAKHSGKTIFNSNRLCKSTGATTITESPDAKRLADTTREARALTIARRRSFYSGGLSRNFERGRRSLHGGRLETLPEARVNEKPDVSFLFSCIFPDDTEEVSPRKS